MSKPPHEQTVPDIAAILDDDLELHAWPYERRGGQHVPRMSCGVLVVHKPTGIAAVSTAERSQLSNKAAAIKLLRELVTAKGLKP